MPNGKGSKGIPHHPLVTALASDPGKPPTKATKLFGYPGPAAEKGSTRLWLDLDLTEQQIDTCVLIVACIAMQAEEQTASKPVEQNENGGKDGDRKADRTDVQDR